jgi:hypothetical protein
MGSRSKPFIAKQSESLWFGLCHNISSADEMNNPAKWVLNTQTAAEVCYQIVMKGQKRLGNFAPNSGSNSELSNFFGTAPGWREDWREKKGKALTEQERKVNPSEMSSQGTSKPKENKALMGRRRMERDKSSVQPGKSEMMMQQGKSRMEHRQPQTKGFHELQKMGPGHAVTPVQPGNPSQKLQ